MAVYLGSDKMKVYIGSEPINVKVGADINLITFTINSISYQAEEGMTWEEFINSPYNDGKFAIYSTTSVSYDSYPLFSDSSYSNEVLAASQIIANSTYYLE